MNNYTTAMIILTKTSVSPGVELDGDVVRITLEALAECLNAFGQLCVAAIHHDHMLCVEPMMLRAAAARASHVRRRSAMPMWTGLLRARRRGLGLFVGAALRFWAEGGIGKALFLIKAALRDRALAEMLARRSTEGARARRWG